MLCTCPRSGQRREAGKVVPEAVNLRPDRGEGLPFLAVDPPVAVAVAELDQRVDVGAAQLAREAAAADEVQQLLLAEPLSEQNCIHAPAAGQPVYTRQPV